ncbi:TetR/AcrR family transcriptional regulator [Nesterenkonia sp. HG001]|uniref:TetR/AcrR family transcriptional regulator n=1 Tax=Nesterenkonia sp. HG001 TaxID=2983207 RepID=UPI002AC3D51C|nr:TetR/AcrR family transcriptional regulator [Nesterenkonia sp. HG001]MDZ5077776.1 TetR/AcrR family transcriptional regulator [Nesterenkonia sp. HG001]
MARPRNQTQRRQDLIAATIDTVGRKGLRALSMTDVAEQAGLTRGAVLYYYEDLESLLVEAHRAGIERLGERRDTLVRGVDSSAEQLAVAIRTGLPDGPEDALMRLLYEFDVLAGTSQVHDELVEALYRRQLATYTSILQRGAASGDFAPRTSIETLAMNLVALEDAYGLHIVAGNSLITVEMAEKAMREAAAGLGAPPGAVPSGTTAAPSGDTP